MTPVDLTKSTESCVALYPWVSVTSELYFPIRLYSRENKNYLLTELFQRISKPNGFQRQLSGLYEQFKNPIEPITKHADQHCVRHTYVLNTHMSVYVLYRFRFRTGCYERFD